MPDDDYISILNQYAEARENLRHGVSRPAEELLEKFFHRWYHPLVKEGRLSAETVAAMEPLLQMPEKVRLRNNLDILRSCLDKASSELREHWEASEIYESVVRLNKAINSFLKKLASDEALRFERLQDFLNYTENVFIGRRLEEVLVPRILEGMGYKRQKSQIWLQGGIMEVDFRGEKEVPPNKPYIQGKDVIIVECKTTVNSRDVDEFARKVQIFRECYENERKNWGYRDISVKAWFVACYGWNEMILKRAREKDIIPITKDDLLRHIEEYAPDCDHRHPICPKKDNEKKVLG